MTTPTQRLTRLLNEGARFMVELPGSISIDLTPDVIAVLGGTGEANACVHGHDRLTRLPGHNHETDST
jgi:hypothetical protein